MIKIDQSGNLTPSPFLSGVEKYTLDNILQPLIHALKKD